MFKSVYFGLFFGASLLGAVALVQASHTEGITQKIAGVIGVGGATTALTTLGLGIAYNSKEGVLEREFKGKLSEQGKLKDKAMLDAQNVFNNILNTTVVSKDKKFTDTEQKHSREVSGLKLEINEFKTQIKALEVNKESHVKQIAELQERLNNKAEQYLKLVAEKDLKIKSLEDYVNAKDTRIEDFLEECKVHTASFFTLRYNNLDAIQKALELADVNEEIRASFDKRLTDIRELKQELFDAAEDIKRLNLTSFKEVLDIIFEFDNKFLNVKTRWKDAQVKDFKSEAKTLKTSLDASITKVDARARIVGAMDEVDVRITEKYEALLMNNNSIHSQLLDLVEQRNLIIDELTKENETLKRPLQAMGTHSYAVAANRISEFYYEQLGYRLDFIQWLETHTGYNITYATRQNNALTNKHNSESITSIDFFL